MSGGEFLLKVWNHDVSDFNIKWYRGESTIQDTRCVVSFALVRGDEILEPDPGFYLLG